MGFKFCFADTLRFHRLLSEVLQTNFLCNQITEKYFCNFRFNFCDFLPIFMHNRFGVCFNCNLPIIKFDIHVSLYRNIIRNCSQHDATFLEFIYFLQTLYMFQAVPPPNHQEHIKFQVPAALCAPDDGRRNLLKHVERL